MEFKRGRESGSARPTPTGAKVEELDLPSKGLFVFQNWEALRRLHAWRKVLPPAAGLVNHGNTCFLNATLQCLAATPVLTQQLATELRNPIKTSDGQLRGHALVRANLAYVLAAMRAKSRQVFSPKRIVRNLRIIGRQFHFGHQEDSHEFLRCLLESLHQAELHAAGVPDNAPGRRAETSFVHAAFGGYTRSQVKCPQCPYASNTYSPFLDLSLTISKRTPDVKAALKRFTASERLDADNAWKCSGCGQRVQASKGTKLHRTPNVLTLQLKRFAFGGGGGMFGGFGGFGGGFGGGRKLGYPVAFAPSLDLAPYCSKDVEAREGSPPLYDLQGVLVHSGSSLHSGHYYSFVKCPNGMWVCANDEDVSAVKLSTVLAQQAYMLFYTRRTPVTPCPKKGQ